MSFVLCPLEVFLVESFSVVDVCWKPLVSSQAGSVVLIVVVYLSLQLELVLEVLIEVLELTVHLLESNRSNVFELDLA